MKSQKALKYEWVEEKQNQQKIQNVIFFSSKRKEKQKKMTDDDEVTIISHFRGYTGCSNKFGGH